MTTIPFSDKEYNADNLNKDLDKLMIQRIIADLLKSGKYELERDGWSQMKPEYFIEAGFPKSFIDPLITTFVSDGTWKGSLWKDENKAIIAYNQFKSEAEKLTVKQVKQDNWTELIDQDVLKRFLEVYIHESKGVYYLTFLRALTQLFELKPSEVYHGRGSQAGEYIRTIHKHLGINKDDFGEMVVKE